MSKNTLTFELGGRIELKSLEAGITAFRRLVSALTPSNERVAWVVEDLQPGSAVTTLRGEADNPAVVERIVKNYGNVGDLLARQRELSPYKPQVKKAAASIMDLTDTLEYVRFETSDHDHIIYGNGDLSFRSAPSVSIGAVTGRIQTLSNRNGLRFNLYGSLFDKAIACYLSQGQEEMMREAWGKRARVSGRVSREATTAKPISIRNIIDVEILEEPDRRAYRKARGVISWKPGDKLPEQAIREMRDAE